MRPVVVLNAVGLTRRQIGERTPNLERLAAGGALAPMSAVLPAVTCAAQATLLTGLLPSAHGAVGNGWFFRELGEVLFWRQSNALVAGQKLYERARAADPGFTCAKLFWWWNQGAAVDWSLTPKPFYPADGRKILAIQGTPEGFAQETESELGAFPFLEFWGPKAGIGSSRWIARATVRTLERCSPALTLAYLPHLDYDHQRHGPTDPRSLAALSALDHLIGEVAQAAQERGAAVVVVSEYGIEDVRTALEPNRILRRAGLLAVRATPAGEILDVFASRAFAVCDHQVAHLYAADERSLAAAREALEGQAGIERVLDAEGKREAGLDHPRAGDLVLVAGRGAWFAYPYWLEPSAAPDFAPTVDIHRKPGYDPCELFLDPGLKLPALRVARRLLQKKLGMRYLMDVVPTDPGLVRGSHGRLPDDPADGPVFLSSEPFPACGADPAGGVVECTSFADRVLALLAG